MPARAIPSANAPDATQTSYVAVVGPNAAWAGEKPRKLADFGKDVSHTIMLVEATNSGIAWAEPKDFSLDTLGATDGRIARAGLDEQPWPARGFFFIYDPESTSRWPMAAWIPADRYRSNEDLRKLLQIGGYTRKMRFEEACGSEHLNWPNIAALAVWLLSVGTLLTHAVRSRKVPSVPPPPSVC